MQFINLWIVLLLFYFRIKVAISLEQIMSALEMQTEYFFGSKEAEIHVEMGFLRSDIIFIRATAPSAGYKMYCRIG